MTATSSPYAQLWRLGAGKSHSRLHWKEQPQAAALLRELELDHLEADSSIDRQLHQLMELHQKDGDQRSAQARLCLRCRASGVAAWRLKDLVANYRNLSRRALQPELEEFASFILDDMGQLDPDGASARQPHEPFLLWLVRHWDPDRGSLPAWVKTAINGLPGVKKGAFGAQGSRPRDCLAGLSLPPEGPSMSIHLSERLCAEELIGARAAAVAIGAGQGRAAGGEGAANRAAEGRHQPDPRVVQNVSRCVALRTLRSIPNMCFATRDLGYREESCTPNPILALDSLDSPNPSWVWLSEIPASEGVVLGSSQ